MSQRTRTTLRSALGGPIVEAGWWDANIPADASPAECVALVERLRPDHPALPRLRQIARMAAQGNTRADRGAEVVCPLCSDTTWVEIDSDYTRDGNRVTRSSAGTVVPCLGPTGMGCPETRRRKEKARQARPEKARTGDYSE